MTCLSQLVCFGYSVLNTLLNILDNILLILLESEHLNCNIGVFLLQFLELEEHGSFFLVSLFTFVGHPEDENEH